MNVSDKSWGFVLQNGDALCIGSMVGCYYELKDVLAYIKESSIQLDDINVRIGHRKHKNGELFFPNRTDKIFTIEEANRILKLSEL